jgi:hypothetical protein
VNRDGIFRFREDHPEVADPQLQLLRLFARAAGFLCMESEGYSARAWGSVRGIDAGEGRKSNRSWDHSSIALAS